MRRFIGPFLALIVAASLVACRGDFQYGGDRLNRPARRIISLSPSTTEILALGGATTYLGGRTDVCNYPNFFNRYPIVVHRGKIDFETIAKRPPHLAVYDGLLYSQAEIKKLEDMGIKTYSVGGNTLDEFSDSLFKLAAIYGGETYISDYVDKILASEQAASSDPVTPTPTVAIVMPGGSGEHWIVGTKSFQADVVRAATGTLVGPNSDKFEPMNAESFIKLDPDVIFTTGPSDGFINDPRMKALKAVKTKRVVPVLADAILRRGWRVPATIDSMHSALKGARQ